VKGGGDYDHPLCGLLAQVIAQHSPLVLGTGHATWHVEHGDGRIGHSLLLENAHSYVRIVWVKSTFGRGTILRSWHHYAWRKATPEEVGCMKGAGVYITTEHIQEVRGSNCVIYRERAGEATQQRAVKGVRRKPDEQQQNAGCAQPAEPAAPA
jgi:hypothetical protein